MITGAGLRFLASILGYTSMLDLSFCYITCAAVVVTVYWPSNPRHEIIILQASALLPTLVALDISFCTDVSDESLDALPGLQVCSISCLRVAVQWWCVS